MSTDDRAHTRAVEEALATGGVAEAKRVHERGVAAQLERAKHEPINLTDLMVGRAMIVEAAATRPVQIIESQVRRLGIDYTTLIALSDRKLRVHQKDEDAGMARNSDIELDDHDTYTVTVHWIDMRLCEIPGVGFNPTYAEEVITSVYQGVHAEDLPNVVGHCRSEDIDRDGAFWRSLGQEEATS